MKKKIVALGGGTGMSSLLRGLKDFPADITAVITVSDNGSSTGKLRQEFSIPAIGDIRKVLTNLSSLPDEVKEIMEYRFHTYSDLNGHPIGNLILTALLNKTGNLKKSIEYLSTLLDVKQKVLPLSEDSLTLMGETTDGTIIEGEANVTEAGKKIKRVFYKQEPNVLSEVIDAIKEADLVIISMGSLYTSIMPHLICKEVVQAVRHTKGKVMYLCNAMTQPGETDTFTVSDHLEALEKYLGKHTIDVVVASNTKINPDVLHKYQTTEEKDPVVIDYEQIDDMGIELIEGDLLTTEDGTIRHDSMKLSSLIFAYLFK
ncbi:MAG: hypothetical protein DBY23_00965 [Bacillota bacterium]|nr:MAG: hypothetical protein DBY23_00965 [Bacillota bacterium]